MTERVGKSQAMQAVSADGRDQGRLNALKFIASAALAGITIPTISIEGYFLAREYGLIDWVDQNRHELDIFLPQEEPCEASISSTIYTEQALQSTFAIAAGDSIGKGYWKKGQRAIPAISFATEDINQNLRFRQRFNLEPEQKWESLVIAEEGAKITDLQRQLTDSRIEDAFKNKPNIDFWVSIGGNDIVNSLARRAAQIRHLDEDQLPWDNPEFFTIDKEMIQAIADYKDNFRNVLSSIVAGSRGNLNRLVIEGLPNLGAAKKIVYIGRDGRTQAEFPLKDKPIAQYLARNLSVLVNNAMKQVINEMLKKSHNFALIFLDNFHDLDEKNLLGEHPTPDGQKKIAADFFYRAYSERMENLGAVLYPNANPALTSRRSLFTFGICAERYGYHRENVNNELIIPYIDYETLQVT